MQGEEEAVKIRAQTDKDKTILLADSYMQAEKTKGEGTTIVLPGDSEFFKYLSPPAKE